MITRTFFNDHDCRQTAIKILVIGDMSVYAHLRRRTPCTILQEHNLTVPNSDDGTIDNSDANGLLKAPKSSLSTAAPLGDKKLGPKANQGAINAGLRALDRTGTPCRKWVRKGFQLKSFTGVTWQLPSWKPPNTKRIDLSGSSKENSDRMGSSDSKVQGSSAVDSEKSNSGMDFDPTSPITPATAKNGASSPVIVVPATV